MKTLLLLLAFFVTTTQAATVRLYFVDPLTNDKDTNAFYVTPIGTNILSNGGVIGRGNTVRYVPASDGYRTNTLAVGHYSITNRSLGSGVVIRVPESSSLYDYTNLLVSGYNIFVTITNGSSGGTSGALTNNETRAVTLQNSLTISNNGNAGAIKMFDAIGGSVSFSNTGNAISFSGGIVADNYVGDGAAMTGVATTAQLLGATNAATLTASINATNGLVAGLAAGSYDLAGNGAGLTNLIEATGTYSPQHFNVGKTPVLHGLLRSNLPVRMLVFGDDAFVPTSSIITAFTNMGLKIHGTGGGSTYSGVANYVLLSVNGTTTFTDLSGSNPYIIATVGMANGSSGTNVVAMGQNQGIDTDRIAIKHWKNTGFGTLNVFTNSFGATPVLFQSINCNVGSFAYFVTTFDVPNRISNCVVSVVSSGTNFIASAGIAQWKTNGQSIRLDQYTGGNVGYESFTSDSVKSNVFRTLLTDFDVLVATDLGGGYADSVITNFWDMIKENNLKLDVVFTTSIIQSNNGSYDSRKKALTIGRLTPFVVIDTAAFLAPTNKNLFSQMYETDNPSHLLQEGDAWLGARMMTALGWNSDGLRYEIPNQVTNYFFSSPTEWRNQSGLLTMTDLYTVLGTPYRTWGVYVAAGTYGLNATIPYPANMLGNRKRIYGRLLVLTTNAISCSIMMNHAVFPIGTNITSWAVPAADSSGGTLGVSGQTNIAYTEWMGLNPTVRGPYAGWLQLGYGGTSKAHSSFVIGAEFRADPDNAFDNW